MKKNGFTLVELLGVIVILGVLGLIAFPPIINQIRTMRNKVSSATLKIISSAAYRYMNDNNDNYPIIEDASYCIVLEDIVLDGKLGEPITDAISGKEIALDRELYVTIGAGNDINYELKDAGECGYIDPSFAKAPVFVDGMIPVVYSVNKWVKADVNEAWYNYDNKEWANAVFVTNNSRSKYRMAEAGVEVLESDILMYYVWIPRFRYKISNAAFLAIAPKSFEIIFEGRLTTKSTGTLTGTWKTHPAFTFNSTELDGIWMAKFEAGYSGAASRNAAEKSTPEPNRLIVKPSTFAWRNINVFNIHNVMQELNDNGNMYGLNSSADVHLTKNMEWGALSYLTYSRYGKNDEVWINPVSDYITGCAGAGASVAASATCQYAYNTANGMQASSTGNVTGIYDISGGAWDYVMATQFNTAGNTNLTVASSGFAQAAIDNASFTKYIDKYLYGTTFSDQAAYNRSQIGDALGETRGWFGDTATMKYTGNAYIARGGAFDYAATSGVFCFNNAAGQAGTRLGFRPVIIKQ